MSQSHPALLKSSFASFGYETDGFVMSMVDVIGVVDHSADVPMGEACIIGTSPIGVFANLRPNTVAIHRTDPDVWDFFTPLEVRVVINKGTGKIMVWDQTTEVWTSL